MAAEVLLVGVAKVVLEEGVKFLYHQADKVIDAWHARRKDPTAPLPVIVPAPAEVTVATPQPSTTQPDGNTVYALEDLRDEAKKIANGEVSVEDPAARATIAGLREVLEAALGTSITFDGEAARPVNVRDINIVVNDVRGQVTGVSVAGGQGGSVTGVTIQAHDVEAGGNVTGVEIGGADPYDADEEPKPERPIRILFLAANPVDTDPLRLDEEIRAIDQALREAKYRDRFEIEQQWAVRIGDLQSALLRYTPDIVHFSGHGTETSEIVLQTDSGAGVVVPADALAKLFSAFRDIRCVVLNACYSEGQAQAIANTVDCVVGMTTDVGDDAAIKFATAFYRALGYGLDVQAAFDLGKIEIGLRRLPDEGTPQLVARKGNAAGVSFVSTG